MCVGRPQTKARCLSQPLSSWFFFFLRLIILASWAQERTLCLSASLVWTHAIQYGFLCLCHRSKLGTSGSQSRCLIDYPHAFPALSGLPTSTGLLLGLSPHCFLLLTFLKAIWLLCHSPNPANLSRRLHLELVLPTFPSISRTPAYYSLPLGLFQNSLEVQSVFIFWCMIDFNLQWGCFCYLKTIHLCCPPPIWTQDHFCGERIQPRGQGPCLVISALPLPAQRKWSLRICESISELINEHKQSSECQDICLIWHKY